MSGNVGFTYIYTYHENGKLESYTLIDPKYQIPEREIFYYPSGKIKLEMTSNFMILSDSSIVYSYASYGYYYESGNIKYSYNTTMPTLNTYEDGSSVCVSEEQCTPEQAREKLLAEAKGN